MKNTIVTLLLTLFLTNSFSQTLEVSLSHFQSFYHSKDLETNEAIKEQSITYTESYYTDAKLDFDLTKKIFVMKSATQKDTFNIREVRRNSDVVEVDVIYPNNLLVNYFISKIPSEKRNVILCRWVEGDKIVGWADKFIKVKKGF